MVVLSKIYTRTGDAGQTALGNGTRVAKHSPRVSAYGTVDETNATVGLARLHASGEMAEALKRISNDLFDLGADLCTPDRHLDATRDYPALRMIEAQVTRLEHEIDAMNERLTPLRSFILPGGSRVNAELHVCRTVCRRAERLLVTATHELEIDLVNVRYLNRLSDAFFVWSRWANVALGVVEVLWSPNLSSSP